MSTRVVKWLTSHSQLEGSGSSGIGAESANRQALRQRVESSFRWSTDMVASPWRFDYLLVWLYKDDDGRSSYVVQLQSPPTSPLPSTSPCSYGQASATHTCFYHTPSTRAGTELCSAVDMESKFIYIKLHL